MQQGSSTSSPASSTVPDREDASAATAEASSSSTAASAPARTADEQASEGAIRTGRGTRRRAPAREYGGLEGILEGLSERARPLRGFIAGIGFIEVLAMALAVRGLFVLTSGFPLNDGGLFYVFTQDIQAAGYRLPEYSTYNDGSIPFAYPPLAFYLAALVEDLTPLSLLQVIWLLPLVGSAGVVAAFYFLARSLIHHKWTVVLATAAFALAPRSYLWLIMGGGLTRALALTLTLLALHQAYRATREDRWAPAVRASVLLALVVLTTLETAAWAAFSLPLFMLFPFVSRQVFARRALMLGAVGLGALVMTAPWWGTVIAYHGLDPFLAAREYGGSAIGQMDVGLMWDNLTNPVHTGEPFFPLIAALGLLGAVYSMVRGQWLIPAWWALTVVMGTRAFPTLATVPIAMLAAVGVISVIGPALLHAGSTVRGGVTRTRQVAVGAVGVGALLFAIGAALEDEYGDQRYLRSLTPTEVEAMEWIAEETPSDARFLVLSRNGWFADRDGEWFPALADRENVSTVQGYEWVEDEFARRIQLQVMSQMCLPSEGNCLGQLSQLEDFEYVYVPETCCDQMRALVEDDRRYVPIFENGATVFQRVSASDLPDRPGWPPDDDDNGAGPDDERGTAAAVAGPSP